MSSMRWIIFFFFSSRRRHTRSLCDWNSDVCSSDLAGSRGCGTHEVPADARRTVAEALRAAILRGEFVPRQRLVEADLCERFGASRFIVRAVLQDLAAQGLVEFQRNRGARVREISLAEAIEITEV